MTPDEAKELGRCYASPVYFADNYCRIYDSVTSDWIPFDLWPAQKETLQLIHTNQLVVILKARQIGLSWSCLAYALWQILFRPIASVSLFSRRDTEALYLLGQDRLRGMYTQLPEWMRSGHVALVDSGHEWALSNGSVVRAFPTSAGDSYVSTLAIVDEADLSPDLNKLMRAVKPTIDNGGKLILLSRVDKTRPLSEFKAIYRGAKDKANGWASIFLPWHVHPGRDAAWYERQRVDILSRTGSLDDLYEQYPATDTESLAPRSLDKRIPMIWVERCYQELKPLPLPAAAPPIEALQVFSEPLRGRQYIVGCDTAEGNPTSDDSAIAVVDKETGDEVAALAGKFQPNVTAAYCKDLSAYYNGAAVLVERNNHGHAVILWLQDNFNKRLLINGHDGRPGWNDNSLGKTMLYSTLAESFRTEEIMVHSFETYLQLVSIEGSSLRAPEGLHDDRADAFALANIGREFAGVTGRKTAKVMQRGDS